MLRKIISLFLAAALITGFSLLGAATETLPNGTLSISSQSTENKVFSTASLDDNFADDCVLVVMNNAVSLTFQTYDALDFPEIACTKVYNLMPNTENQVKSRVERLKKETTVSKTSSNTPAETQQEINENKYHQILCIELEESDKASVLRAIKALQCREDILYVGPNYYYQLCAIPNDEYYGNQWAPAAIGLPGAWNIETGSDSVKVGIIDTGINMSHEDLEHCINTNDSYDIMTKTVGTHTDTCGHGTKVAGILAAKGNNNYGISGVCWNIDLISLKFCENNNYIDTKNVTTAIEYAQSNDIGILCYSTVNNNHDSVLQYTLRQYTGLFICCAGNDAKNLDEDYVYPSVYNAPNMICVGASTESNQAATFSNFGKNTVDIFAPGQNLLTTSSCGTGCDECRGYSTPTPGYHSVSGTSYAAPYVAAVAALIKSKYPTLNDAQIKDRIMKSVYTNVQNGVNIFEDLCVSGGILNAFSAVHDHTLSYIDEDNAVMHYAYCTGSITCAYKTYEEHLFSAEETGYVCVGCGFYSDLIP